MPAGDSQTMADARWMDIIEEGWRAGYRGDDPRTNPHPKLTEEWDCWNRWHANGVEASKE